jgi:hypothetical protein
MEELKANIGATLIQLKVDYKEINVIKNTAALFTVDMFGVAVCAINRKDYSLVETALKESYAGWRIVYITSQDDYNEKKFEIIWDLMRSGYLRWLRSERCSDSEFRRMMFDGGFANKLLSERIKMWGDDPKYRYFKECDVFAKGQGRISEYLSKEPAFFDFMPE